MLGVIDYNKANDQQKTAAKTSLRYKLEHSEDMFIEMEEGRPQYKYQEGREAQTYKYYKLQEKEAEHAASHNKLRI